MDTFNSIMEDWQPSYLLLYIVTAILIFIVAGDPTGIGSRYKTVPGAQIFGAKFPLEPRWLTRRRFYSSGWDIIQQGCVTGRIFTVLRPESNITVIPRKYVDELANLPEDQLATNEATVNDMMREYTGSDILLKRHMGHHAVNTKLTPQLDLLVFTIREEVLTTAKENPLLVTDEWSEQKLSPYISMLMGRITSHLFLGPQQSETVALILNIVGDIAHIIMIMRNAPRFTHPLLGAVIPPRKQLKKHMEKLHQVLEPLIEKRMANDAKYGSRGQLNSAHYNKPNDVMQWMMDVASDEEYTPENLADRFVYTIMGSIRSVVDAVVNSLYELCQRPQYIEPLREELTTVLTEDGGWGKRTASRLLKTDSFIKETTRHYPPSALAFRRLTKQEITLHDGVVLPRDTYVCVGTTSPSLDEVSRPDEFLGFRYYDERVAKNKEGVSRYDYSATDKNHLGFGHGKFACPGRFAASIEAKMLLAHIILQYDIKLPPGRSERPKRVKLMDYKKQDEQVTTYMRKRQPLNMTLSDFEKKQ